MPSYIVKPEEACDEYVYWSTVVEAPLFVGCRDELVRYLKSRPGHDIDVEDRIGRADASGSSALWPSIMAPYLGYGETTIYEQRGVVRCADMGRLARRLEADEPIGDLLEPLEDS
jgi:hypothetical protein